MGIVMGLTLYLSLVMSLQQAHYVASCWQQQQQQQHPAMQCALWSHKTFNRHYRILSTSESLIDAAAW